MTTKALQTLDTPYLALSNSGDFADLIAINLGGALPTLQDLPKVSMPAAGSLFWTVADEPVKVLTGVMLDSQNKRIYWSKSFEESGGAPPDCTSDDGVIGYARLEGDDPETAVPVLWADTKGRCMCAACPFAQFGSKGYAMACQQRRDLVMLLQDRLLPIVVSLSSTSMQQLTTFALSLASQGKRLDRIEMSMSLEKAVSKGGITYSKAKFEKVRDLGPEEVTQMAAYGQAFRRVKAQEVAA